MLFFWTNFVTYVWSVILIIIDVIYHRWFIKQIPKEEPTAVSQISVNQYVKILINNEFNFITSYFIKNSTLRVHIIYNYAYQQRQMRKSCCVALINK